MNLISTLLFLLNVSSIFIFISKNPIYAALWLIFTFVNASLTLWIFSAEFFALIYIIIYVGAIAVLILFVIMMLDIKTIDSFSSNIYNQSTTAGKFFVLLAYLLPIFLFSYLVTFSFEFDNNLDLGIFYPSTFDTLSYAQIIGQTIFNYYILCLIIAGLILLVAMIGAIVLTLDFNTFSKIKITSRQLSRSDNFLSFFK